MLHQITHVCKSKFKKYWVNQNWKTQVNFLAKPIDQKDTRKIPKSRISKVKDGMRLGMG